MRKKVSFIWLWAVLFLLCACGKKGPTWQEQYDLGMKYLNTEDYEEAVTAFQVAISIDPKQQPAYIGAADAYVGMAGSGNESIDADKCYAAAEENYQKALEIDETTDEIYVKFADLYIKQDEREKAEEILDDGLDKTNSEEIQEKLEELKRQDQEEQERQEREAAAAKAAEEEKNRLVLPEDAIGIDTWNGHTYALINHNDSWEEANRYADSLGGHLATITSEEENAAVFSYMRDWGAESAYFGLCDSETEGEWKWVTGEPVDYVNWHEGEPNAESENEDYAMFYYKYEDGTWNDGDFGGWTANGGTCYIVEWNTIVE